MRRINNIYFRISLLVMFLIPFIQVGKIIKLGDIVQYSYGFPFKFIEVYQRSYEKKWLVDNLFSGNDGINLRILGFFLNVLILYWLIIGVLYLYKKFKHKKH